MSTYVQPNSTIILYKGVELDNTYNHTFYFRSPAERENMFNTDSSNTSSYKQYAIARVDAQMYQVAKDSNVIRLYTDHMNFGFIGANETYYDVNYIRFKNTNYENKWFYAFVTKVEYLNDHVVEFTYELDVMTTFFFDYELDPCFIEREHAGSDTIEYRRVPESLEYGQYITRDDGEDDILHSFGTRGWSLVLITTEPVPTFNSQNQLVRSPVSFQRKGGLPTSFSVYTLQYCTWLNVEQRWSYTDNTILQNWYNDYIDPFTKTGMPEDAIVGLYLFPSSLAGAISGSYPSEVTVSFDRPTDFLYQGRSYIPFNAKTLDYPYSFLQIYDTIGNTGAFAFEDSTHTNSDQIVDLAFRVVGNTTSGSPSEIIIPINYKGIDENILESMTFSNPPSIGIITDTYKEWLASNGTLTMLSGVRGALGAGSNVGSSLVGIAAGSALTAATGVVGAVAGTASLLTSVFTTMAKFEQAEIKPNHSLNTANANVLTALTLMSFRYAMRQITPEMARCIDDYFSMFGYACHQVKVPNRAVRHRWTYTKTLGCIITPSNGNWDNYKASGIPNIFVDKITSIYDKGITFWKVSQKGKVGKYTQTIGSDSENYPDVG